jgi:hexokinase
MVILPQVRSYPVIKDQAAEFLSRHGMLSDDISLKKYIEDFQSEMDQGLAGADSTLAMIPTYIDAKPEIPRNKKVVVLDAGGTNLRAALVHFDENGKGVIENFSKVRMPGYEKEVSLDEFYSVFANRIKDFVDQSDLNRFLFLLSCRNYSPNVMPYPLFLPRRLRLPKS